MARLRQRLMAFKTAERQYKRRKNMLRQEYSLLLADAAKQSNWSYFDDLASDAKLDLGDSFGFTIIGYENLYKRN